MPSRGAWELSCSLDNDSAVRYAKIVNTKARSMVTILRETARPLRQVQMSK